MIISYPRGWGGDLVGKAGGTEFKPENSQKKAKLDGVSL